MACRLTEIAETAQRPRRHHFNDVLEVLNQRHVLLLLLILGKKSPQRFTELQTGPADLTPKVLTRRLEDLVRIGLVGRQAFRETPRRVEYELTAKGRDLLPVYRVLYEWHLRHDGEPIDCTESDRLFRDARVVVAAEMHSSTKPSDAFQLQ